MQIIKFVLLSLSLVTLAACTTQPQSNSSTNVAVNQSDTSVSSAQKSVTKGKVATLMRVTVDGRPASREVLESSFNFETLLLSHLSRNDYEHVDLTPLKSSFQTLRYSHECPIVDGNFSFQNCESFGNYAEAVLQILTNIKMGIDNDDLPAFTNQDRIIISDTQITNLERDIRVDMYLRVYEANSQKLVFNDTLHREQRMGSKGHREGMTVKLVNRIVAQAVDTLAENDSKPAN